MLLLILNLSDLCEWNQCNEKQEGILVFFTAVDHLNKLTINMPSKRLRINPSARMLSEMKEMQLEVGFDTN